MGECTVVAVEPSVCEHIAAKQQTIDPLQRQSSAAVRARSALNPNTGAEARSQSFGCTSWQARIGNRSHPRHRLRLNVPHRSRLWRALVQNSVRGAVCRRAVWILREVNWVTLQVRDCLGGRYRLEGPIGYGGMARVFRAETSGSTAS
jgi:hypothetical protein